MILGPLIWLTVYALFVGYWALWGIPAQASRFCVLCNKSKAVRKHRRPPDRPTSGGLTGHAWREQGIPVTPSTYTCMSDTYYNHGMITTKL